MRQPVFAIVGRPNVGKSTLFNRIAGRPIAIVEDMPGVTRDRIYADADLIVDDTDADADRVDARVTIIDTGGFEPIPSSIIFAAVREQTQLAIEEADVILFVVDARSGVLPDDVEVARLLRKSGRPLVVAANKADDHSKDALAGQFYELGVREVLPISASHGRGIDDLLEAAFAQLSPELRQAARDAGFAFAQERGEGKNWDEALDAAEAELLAGGDDDDDAPAAANDDADDSDDADGSDDADADDVSDDAGSPEAAPNIVALPTVLRMAVIGRPNAGKSSLVNKLLGEERHVVSDIPGTTVDAVDSFLEHGGQRFRLIDTAGIRRKRSIAARMEKFAVVSALKGMDRADLCLHVIDAKEGLTEQDKKVAAFAADKGKAVVFVINKWDLAKENELDAEEYAEKLRYEVPFLEHAPIRFVSAKTGKRVFDLLDSTVALAREHFTRVPTAQVNRSLQAAVAAHQPPMHKGHRVKLLFATQVAVAPPTFVVATNDKEGVHFSYRRFLINRLRADLGLKHAPIRLFFRERKSRASEMAEEKAKKDLRTHGKASAKATGKRAKKAGTSRVNAERSPKARKNAQPAKKKSTRLDPRRSTKGNPRR